MRVGGSALAAVLATGCSLVLDPSAFVGDGDAGGAMDAGVAMDAGGPTDGGAEDGGLTDGGPTPVDAGPGDAGGADDAGGPIDAGSGLPVAQPASQLAYYRELNRDQNHLVGWFLDTSPQAASCTELRTEGACTAWSCDGSTPMTLSAGTVSASVAGSVLVERSFGAAVYQIIRMGDFPVLGTPVTMAASGGVVPAFAAEVPRGEAAMIPFPGSLTVGNGPTLSWSTPISADELEVDYLNTGGGLQVRCRVDASDGALNVPDAVFGELAPGTVNIFVRGYRRVDVTAGTRVVELRAGVQYFRAGVTLE